jgi:hypothetical protein
VLEGKAGIKMADTDIITELVDNQKCMLEALKLVGERVKELEKRVAELEGKELIESVKGVQTP